MKLGMQVGLGAGHIVLDGDPRIMEKTLESESSTAVLPTPSSYHEIHYITLK